MSVASGTAEPEPPNPTGPPIRGQAGASGQPGWAEPSTSTSVLEVISSGDLFGSGYVRRPSLVVFETSASSGLKVAERELWISPPPVQCGLTIACAWLDVLPGPSEPARRARAR